MLAVERLEARRLVGEVEKMPAVFGEKPHLKPVVLKRDVFVRLVYLVVVQYILHRIWIDPALRALIDAACVEEGRLVVPARRVCGQNNTILLHYHFSSPDGSNCERRKKHAD